MKPAYLLDTNICIYIIKRNPAPVLKHFESLQVGQVAMSTITLGELIYGACKSQHSKKTLEIVEKIAGLISPIPISPEVGKYYGIVRCDLEKKGKVIGNNDLWIAAQALSLNITLVTNNTKEFARVPNLKLENWVT